MARAAGVGDRPASGVHRVAAGDGRDIRNALISSLRSDKDPGVRMKALQGLERYVRMDENVRDAVALALLACALAANWGWTPAATRCSA